MAETFLATRDAVSSSIALAFGKRPRLPGYVEAERPSGLTGQALDSAISAMALRHPGQVRVH